MPYTNGKDKLDDSVQYQRLVVKLIYLTITRPDIAYSISSYESVYGCSKGITHEQRAEGRYVKGSPSLGLLMDRKSD